MMANDLSSGRKRWFNEFSPSINWSCYSSDDACYQVWDLGGQERLRTSWATYYRGTHAVIVVIDSTDRARISIMKDELFRLLASEELQQTVVLVFANKQDLKDAMTPAEITDALSLHSIKNHDWHIQACSALTGDGLFDGLGWIAQRVTGKAPSWKRMTDEESPVFLCICWSWISELSSVTKQICRLILFDVPSVPWNDRFVSSNILSWRKFAEWNSRSIMRIHRYPLL